MLKADIIIVGICLVISIFVAAYEMKPTESTEVEVVPIELIADIPLKVVCDAQIGTDIVSVAHCSTTSSNCLESPCSELGYSEEEIALLERVVMSESSILSIDGKIAVAQTVLNRVESDQFPNTITDVIYQPNAFSTADNGDVNEECRKAVEIALTESIYPSDMVYFRTDHEHNFGSFYMQIGNTIFSTLENYW